MDQKMVGRYIAQPKMRGSGLKQPQIPVMREDSSPAESDSVSEPSGETEPDDACLDAQRAWPDACAAEGARAKRANRQNAAEESETAAKHPHC